MRKRRVLLLVAGLLVSVAVVAHWLRPKPPAARLDGLPVDAVALAEDLDVWARLDDRSRAWRTASRSFRTEVDSRLRDGVLKSSDMTRLYRSGEAYVRQRRRWQALIDCQGAEAWSRMGPGLEHHERERLQSKLVLAAALAQFDDYQLGVNPWVRVDKSRRLLKSDHPALEGELDVSVASFLDPVNRLRLARAVVWHRAQSVAAVASPEERRLDASIRGSAGYAFFTRRLGERLIEEWKTGGHAAVTYVTDAIADAGDEAAGIVSETVGNTVGLVATRDGYLRGLNQETKARITAGLRPLDVLLEKTPFRLTDKSIPGHYGHVALWVGGEAELRELGVWEESLVRPYHARIRAGARIIEALRPGVEINSFESFSNIDDLLVMRRRDLDTAERKAGVLRAFAQLGKAYDFNFDVESDRCIVCSELAFVVFPEVSWPTSKTLGRMSITPDQVAVKCGAGQPFGAVFLWHDGCEVSGRLQESLECLLNSDAGGFRRLHPEFVGRSASK